MAFNPRLIEVVSFKAVPAVSAGQGQVQLRNRDEITTIYLGPDEGFDPAGQAVGIIDPLGSLTVDGTDEIWARSQAGTAVLNAIPGGLGGEVSPAQIAEQILLKGLGGISVEGFLLPSGDTSGATDPANIQSLTSQGLAVTMAAGQWYFNAPVPIALPGASVLGSGYGTVINLVGSSLAFSVAGTAVNYRLGSFAIAATGVLGGLVLVTGIQVTGVAGGCIDQVRGTGLNGLVVDVDSSATAAVVDTMITRIVARNCAGGVRVLGTAATGNLGELFLTGIQCQQIGTTTGPAANLDAVTVQDIGDVLLVSVNAGVVAGTGNGLNIAGACATVRGRNLDLGAPSAAGAGAAVIIQGTPGNIDLDGTFQGGSSTVQVLAGTDVQIRGRAHQAWTTGLLVTGTPDQVQPDLVLAANNQSGLTGYDIDTSGQTAGSTYFSARTICSTPVGAGAGLVTNPVKTNSHAYYQGCKLTGAGTTPSNAFTGTPQIIRGVLGYNPRGQITAPVIGASPYTVSTSQNDVEIIFLTLGGLTAVKINGAPTGLIPFTGTPYHVPARSTIELDWATTAPTWQWYAD